MRTLFIAVLTLAALSWSPGRSWAQEKKAAPEKPAAAKSIDKSSPALREKCEAKCRQDYQNNAAAAQACIRGCGGPGAAGSINLNSSRSNIQ